MEKLTITRVFRSDKDKEGKPLKTKDGRAYEKIAIKTKEYGDKWLSGFGSNWNGSWKEGDIIQVDVEANGEYLNIKKPDPIAALEKRVELLEREVFNG